MARRQAAPAPKTPPPVDGVPLEILDDPPSRAIAVQPPRTLVPYARNLLRWRSDCAIDVLADGAATYAAMLEAIEGAKISICFETYILAADRTGDRFKAALCARARAGVTIRLVYDAIGSFGLPDAWTDELREAGAQVIAYNPIGPWRARFGRMHRDHRKILVIDDRVAFTGGLNIADDYAPISDGGRGWHDIHCRARGTIVRDLARLFRRAWLRAGGDIYPAPARPPEAAIGPGKSFARLIENTAQRRKSAIRRTYVHVIKAARRAVKIENAYFLPDRGMRRALIRAAKRGVEVQIIVPGRSDIRLIEWASLYILRRLAQRGVKIMRWRGAMMHAKTAVIDGAWSTIGSYNFDSQSRFYNLEATVEILDPVFGEAMVRQFDGDLTQCDPFDETTWRKLPWWRKLFAWCAFRLRRIL